MAGSDIAMNQFQIVSDAPYIYVELADGSQGKIKKNDLIQLMADSLLLKKPISINTKKGIEVKTGIIGTCIVSISNKSDGINLAHIIYISRPSSADYETKVLARTWFSGSIQTRMQGDELYITQTTWEQMTLQFRIL